MFSNTSSVRSTIAGFVAPPIPGPTPISIPMASAKAGDYPFMTVTAPPLALALVSAACMIDGFIDVVLTNVGPPFPGGPIDLRILIIRATGSI